MGDGPAARARVWTWNVWWRFAPSWRESQHGLLYAARRQRRHRCLAGIMGRDHDVSGAGVRRPARDIRGIRSTLPATAARPAGGPRPNRYRGGPQPAQPLADRRRSAGGVARPAPHASSGCDGRHARAPSRGGAHRGRLPGVGARLQRRPHRPRHEPGRHRHRPALDGPAPVIVCGDLNADPDSPVRRPLHDALTGAWSAGGGDHAAVTLRPDHPFAPLEADELLDSGSTTSSAAPDSPACGSPSTPPLLSATPSTVFDPSDHKAVRCDLRWTQKPMRQR